MALSRATSNSSDELGATIAGLKSRINELETATGVGGAPVGSIIDFIGASAPAGWTLLDGSTIVNGRFLYPSLWSVLPSNFKVGNNILKPDTRGKVTAHQGGSLLSGAIGTSYGTETVTLTTAEMPSHQHAYDHDHLVTSRSYNVSPGAGSTVLNSNVSGNAGNNYTVGQPRDPVDNTLNKIDTDAAGSGGAHNNVQPTFIVLKIMKLA